MNKWFSVVPFDDCVRPLMALAEAIETEFDAGAWATNMYVRVPQDKESADIARALLTEIGAKFYEIQRAL